MQKLEVAADYDYGGDDFPETIKIDGIDIDDIDIDYIYNGIDDTVFGDTDDDTKNSLSEFLQLRGRKRLIQM